MKVGDYVRTKHKGIFKIDERCHFNKDFKEFWFKAPCDKENEWTTIAEVIKSSPNIIDLIEVGDYVNGYKVRAVYLEGATHYIKLEPRDEKGTRTYNEDIKSIVTKEQFENCMYKVGD